MILDDGIYTAAACVCMVNRVVSVRKSVIGMQRYSNMDA